MTDTPPNPLELKIVRDPTMNEGDKPRLLSSYPLPPCSQFVRVTDREIPISFKPYIMEEMTWNGHGPTCPCHQGIECGLPRRIPKGPKTPPEPEDEVQEKPQQRQLSKEEQELLALSETFKKDALELLMRQISLGLRPEASEEQRMACHMAKIRLIPPADRTATEFLEVMNELYMHSLNCGTFYCDFREPCWRMRGMQYQMQRLKQMDHSAFLALWNRQVVLEMHAEQCQTSNCECRHVDNYRFILLRTLKVCKLLEKGVIERGDDLSRALVHMQGFVQPILSALKLHLYPAARIDEWEKNPKKKSARWLLYLIYDGTRNGFSVKKNQPVRQEKKPSAVVPVLGSVIDPELPGTSSGIQRTVAQQEAMIKAAETTTVGKTPPMPPPNPRQNNENTLAQRMERYRVIRDQLIPDSTTCTHNAELRCNCTVKDIPVDHKIGQRFKLPPRITHCTTPCKADNRKEMILDICKRLRAKADAEKRPLLAEPRVSTISIYIDGVECRVVYCTDVHNVFDEDQYKVVLAKYIFACRYLHSCIIIYNFVGHKDGEGNRRLKDLFSKGVGVAGICTFNMQYIQESCKTEFSAWERMQREAMLAAQNGKFWYSGCNVKLHKGVPQHFWQNEIDNDAKGVSKVVDFYGSKKVLTEKAEIPLSMREDLDLNVEELIKARAEQLVRNRQSCNPPPGNSTPCLDPTKCSGCSSGITGTSTGFFHKMSPATSSVQVGNAVPVETVRTTMRVAKSLAGVKVDLANGSSLQQTLVRDMMERFQQEQCQSMDSSFSPENFGAEFKATLSFSGVCSSSEAHAPQENAGKRTKKKDTSGEASNSKNNEFYHRRALESEAVVIKKMLEDEEIRSQLSEADLKYFTQPGALTDAIKKHLFAHAPFPHESENNDDSSDDVDSKDGEELMRSLLLSENDSQHDAKLKTMLREVFEEDVEDHRQMMMMKQRQAAQSSNKAQKKNKKKNKRK